MINKKVFALTLVAASVIAAGCSSDDDDDDVLDPGTDTGDMTDTDTDTGDTTDPMEPQFVFPEYTADGNSIADVIVNDESLEQLQLAIPPALLNLLDYDEDKRTQALADADAAAADSDTDSDVDVGDEGEDPDDATDMDPATDTPEGDGTDDLDDVDTDDDDDSTVAVADVPDVVNYTVFAPNNDALAAADLAGMNLTGEELSDLLLGHVVQGTIEAPEVVANAAENGGVGGTPYTALNGSEIQLSNNESGGPVINGTINFVAGTDNDDGTQTGGTQVADNGIVHVIDTVIQSTADTTTDTDDDDDDNDNDVDGPTAEVGPALTAISAAGNTRFVQIYNATDFGGSLDDNAWTVFVPSNAAIDEATANTISADGTQATTVIQQHVLVEGALDADTLADGTQRTTFGDSGVPLVVTQDGDDLTVNGFDATEIESEDSAATIYQIEGLLQ